MGIFQNPWNLVELLPAVSMGAVVVVLALLFQGWRPHRLLNAVAADAEIRARCMFGGATWVSQGVAYVAGDTLTLSDGRGRDLVLPLQQMQGIRETLNFPVYFAERLHGFIFSFEGEELWFAVPDYLAWRRRLMSP